ncbi:MAG: ComEA family DNA-binding protein [Acidimicrobiales bacterium]|nr:ComEA family DNA-binding protein [Acidimicrobiales bacterium]
MVDSDLSGPRNLGERIDAALYRWDELRRRPVVIAAAAIAALVAVGGAWLAATQRTDARRLPVEDRIPVVTLAPTAPVGREPAVLLVHVTGAVRSPGVYELQAGDRVFDAIERAGGSSPAGQPDRLNLAAPVADGMQIRVPVEGEPVAVVDAETSGAGPVDLNTATAAQLEGLPGIGPATAAAILDYRDQVGAFGAVSDLLGVRGIGEAKLAALEDLVVVR